MFFLAALSSLMAAGGGAFPYDMQETTLDNGLRVVVVKTESQGLVSVYGVVGTGSRDEVEAGHSGFAHFFEHMMFRGTKKYPSEKRTALLGSLGVDENGYTTDDFTCYSLIGPKEALPQIVELEGDRYANLDYSDDDFKTESRAVLGEYNKNFSNPDEKAYEQLSELAFDKHTYKHTTMGFLKDIQSMPNEVKYSKAFFKRFYTPDNLLFFVVGDVKPDDVVALFKKSFGGWKGKRAVTDVKDEAALTKERTRQVAWDNPTQERFMLGWRIPSGTRNPKDGALALLLRGYLFSASSPLVKDLVLDEQLAEDVSGGYEIHKDAGLFPVGGRVKEGKSSAVVIDKIQAALDELAAGKIDEERFNAVKGNVRYSLLMNLTSADSVGGSLAWAAGPFMDPHAIDIVLGAQAAATPAELVAYTKAHFGKSQRAVVDLKYAPKVKP